MGKEHTHEKAVRLRLLRMKQPVKDLDFFGKKAAALLDEILDANLSTTDLLRTIFGISHLYLDFGQQILDHVLKDDDDEEGAS